MTDKLKTLKDIEFMTDWMPEQSIIEADNVVKIKELKQEAIKWVKELEKEAIRFTPQGTTYYGKEVSVYSSQLVGWIKHFFNLKDSDIIQK